MSRKEIVGLLSRAFALLLISWAIVELTYLPERLMDLSHHVSRRSVLIGYDYWSGFYLLATILNAARMLAMLLAASWFWKCGPRVQALFSVERNSRGEPSDTGALNKS